MIILEGKVPWGIFWDYTQCKFKGYNDLLNPIWIDTVNKKKGTSFHNFAEVYMKDNDKPPDIEFDDPYEQSFHEFEKTRFEYCKKKKLVWKSAYIEETFEDEFFTTKIDRLDNNGDGTFTLVEYKKRPYKVKDIPQMSFSTIILNKYDIFVSKWAIYYTEGEMYYKNPSKNSLNSMLRKMSLGKASMRAGFFPALPGWRCKNCVYANEGCDFQGIKQLVCSSCREIHQW